MGKVSKEIKIKKGRPSLYGSRMLPNGLTVDMDTWLKKHAKSKGITSTELRRKIFDDFRAKVEAGE